MSPHVSSWKIAAQNSPDVELISIHAPRVGRDSPSPRLPRPPWRFQSTRPAWGATQSLCDYKRSQRISIHAPAWGATARELPARHLFPISIHAPAWGATGQNRPQFCHILISIHAPAWGATAIASHPVLSDFHFNPRARVGRDASDRRVPAQAPHFNPRARVGRDASDRRVPAQAPHFNPRARVGRDATMPPCVQEIFRFQSTRPRGARHGNIMTGVRMLQFQSTRPRGARLAVLLIVVQLHGFQSTRA